MKTFRTTGTGNEQTLSEIETDKIPLYPTEQDLLDDLANLEVGQIAGTVDPAESELIGVLIQKIQALESDDVYSTDEVKTNKKWINGKPIYRKVVQFVSPSAPGNVVDLSSQNIDEVISQKYQIHDTNSGRNNYTQMSASYYDDGTWIVVYYNNTTKQIYETGSASWVIGNTITGIIEYTKTTD